MLEISCIDLNIRLFVCLFGWLWFHIHSFVKCKTSGEWSIEMRQQQQQKTEQRDIAFDKINMDEAQTYAHIVYFKKEEKTHALILLTMMKTMALLVLLCLSHTIWYVCIVHEIRVCVLVLCWYTKSIRTISPSKYQINRNIKGVNGTKRPDGSS